MSKDIQAEPRTLNTSNKGMFAESIGQNKYRLPEGVVTLLDPHHRGMDEWAFLNNAFYKRVVGSKKWTQVKRFHATPARIKMLYKLMQLSN